VRLKLKQTPLGSSDCRGVFLWEGERIEDRGARSEERESARIDHFLAPRYSLLAPFRDLSFSWDPAAGRIRGSFGTKLSSAMMPFLSQELLTATVEMVCYVFTAFGVALTVFVARR
jgi:hypothetical protein